MQKRSERSVRGAAIAGFGLAVLAACSASADVKTKPTPSTTAASSPTPSPVASKSRAQEEAAAIEEARSVVLSQANVQGKDAPDEQRLAVAAVQGKAVALTWLTKDGRFCHATIGGFSEIACDSRPERPPVSETPKLVRYEGDPWLGWIEYFAADHEKALSATCNGAPLALRELQTTGGGKRTLYSVAFTERRKGSITVTIQRGTETTTEQLPVDGLYAEGPDCT
ncbi:hypothetical protein [Streptomyces sp. NPDC096339]|uniref:hypothetical protein n=1 Tax=Streptomyces sp. NPDC096339 TaxID=3366086 RepID=UPI0037F5FC14